MFSLYLVKQKFNQKKWYFKKCNIYFYNLFVYIKSCSFLFNYSVKNKVFLKFCNIKQHDFIKTSIKIYYFFIIKTNNFIMGFYNKKSNEFYIFSYLQNIFKQSIIQYSIQLKFIGLGYKAVLSQIPRYSNIFAVHLGVGTRLKRYYTIPRNIFAYCSKRGILLCFTSFNKQLLGSFVYSFYKTTKYNVYTGKGCKFSNKTIRRKIGKKTK